MNNAEVLFKINDLQHDIDALDKEMGYHLKMVKAFFLKGVESVVDNGLLVEVLSGASLDIVCLFYCFNFNRHTLEDARRAGKKFAEDSIITLKRV